VRSTPPSFSHPALQADISLANWSGQLTCYRQFYRKKSAAISWFKDTAHEHLARVRELVVILEHHGVPVRMLKADRVGYVVYEDEFQIVAQPFADTTG
jgi:hypothetical protein